MLAWKHTFGCCCEEGEKKNSRTARNLPYVSLPSSLPYSSHSLLPFQFPFTFQFRFCSLNSQKIRSKSEKKTFLTFNFIVVSLNVLASFAVYFWMNCSCGCVRLGLRSVHRCIKCECFKYFKWFFFCLFLKRLFHTLLVPRVKRILKK